MTIAFFPGNGPVLGPGNLVQIQLASGPVPNDDYVYGFAQAVGGGGSPVTCDFRAITHGSLFPMCILCYEEIPSPLPFTLAVRRAPAGTLFELNVTQFHANGTFVDSGVSGTYTWDPDGYVPGLLAAMSKGSSSLADIRAAVLHTYTNS